MPVYRITINIHSPGKKHIYFMIDIKEIKISPIWVPIPAHRG